MLLCFVLSLSLLWQPQPLAAAQNTTVTTSLDGLAPKQIDSVLAKMSDEQVRSLLISELTSNLNNDPINQKSNHGIIATLTKWLHLLDTPEDKNETSTKAFSRIIQLPKDYISIARKIGNGSLGNFILTLFLLLIVLGAAWGVEIFFRRFTDKFRKQFQKKAIPELDGPMRFIAGIMLAIPSLIHISIFTTFSFLFFLLLPGSDYSPVRYLFLFIFFVIIFHRLLSQVSIIFLSPKSEALRVVPLDDKTAATIHSGIMNLCSFIFTVILFIALQRTLGFSQSSLQLTAMFFGTLLIVTIMTMIMRSRTFVTNRILEKSDLHKTRNWIVEQFALFWHVPIILYFFIIWIIMIGDQLSGIQRENSAFLLSLLFLPLFILFNGLGQWIVRVSIHTLGIYDHDEQESIDDDLHEKNLLAEERERKLYVTTSRIMSLTIFAALLVWALSLWNISIPYASNITNALFESLIAIALGLTVWKFISSYIEKKMLEDEPTEENNEESDDEWGAAATRGRSFTLLPMLRKFIASTLLVMVIMVILSSMGVDIGPLLAGAGVVGLAIGFGAQKMVSDIFSGFFYLLDDAFRVGEYIQAGSVSGAVESITLRNVMLRHHRGMLQIVPHSELGSITNFMRGGIIEKFNLEFAYDADVDKIRKVIKKVGQAMLNEDDFKDDFIQPVKSAGVREITGSIMTIRVKFKTQPGAQFVIKREAYRRISEALAAKGIHYAHRKVIVEIPEQEEGALTAEKKKLLEAGAAAALLQQEEDDKNKS